MLALVVSILAQTPLQPEKVPLPDGIRHGTSFSPDGKWLYYFEAVPKTDKIGKHARNSALFRASFDGKTVEKIIEIGNTVGEVRWHPDRKRMALVRRTDDTNGDGKIDQADGDSLWMGEWDAKNPQVVVPPSPKKLSFYGFLADEKIVLGYRDSSESVARVVVRDAAGKEEELCQADRYLLTDDPMDWMATAETGDAHGRELKWHRFAFETKEKKEALAAPHLVGRPLRGDGRLWYVRRKDGGPADRNTLLVVCKENGTEAREITKGDEVVFPQGFWAGRLVCIVHRSPGSELVLFDSEGRREILWTSPTSIAGWGLSRDKRRAWIGVVRDTTGDGKSREWEDATDLLVAQAPTSLQPPSVEDEKRYQAYFLETVKKLVSAGPQETVLGLYLGRKSMSTFRASIKPSSEIPPGAAFEISVGIADKHAWWALLNQEYQPIRFTLEEKRDGVAVRTIFMRTESGWKGRGECGRKVLESSHESVWSTDAGTVLTFIPIVPLKGDPIRAGSSVLRSGGTRKIVWGGREQEATIVESAMEQLGYVHSYLDASGSFLFGEMLVGAAPIRIYRIPVERIGKDLDPRPLKESEKTAALFLSALSRKDATAASALVDFVTMAKEADPKFESLAQDKKDQVLKELRTKFEERWLPAAANPSTEPPEDLYGPGFETVEQGTTARIRSGLIHLGLAQATDGERKGKWLVFRLNRDQP